MNVFLRSFFLISVLLTAAGDAQADESNSTAPAVAVPVRSSADILNLAWKASNEGNLTLLNQLVDEMMASYEVRAKILATELSNFPSRDVIDNYKIMNDVATALFVKAEALMHQGKNDESKAVFNQVIKQYPWAQNFDPSRGSYWSVLEKSQASLDVMDGRGPQIRATRKETPKTIPHLAFPGKDRVIDYRKYGEYLNVGTKDYHYRMTDQAGLVAAVGEGIYPNLTDIYKNPAYKKALKEGRLEGSHWDFVNSEDLEAAYFKWATAPEAWGVRLFYMGIVLEKAKLYNEAIKAYQAIVVHFPNTMAWTYWQTPWYPGQAAIAKIQHIIRMHPQLRLEFKWAKIQIINSFDNDPSNDITITKPGVIRELNSIEIARSKLHLTSAKIPLGNPMKYSSQGRIRFAKYESGHWQLLIGSRPFLIKGVTYAPTKVGQSPDKGTMANWMEEEPNPAYTAWIDKNGNGAQDSDEHAVGDFAIMKEMGVNTLRMYHQPMKINKAFMNRMFKDYGFMVMMGDFFGKYAIGSGASWSEGTDYENPEHQQKMMASVRDMVMEFKDEPYILMWVLGNENNYGVASNADKKPESYFKFVNEVALMIKSIDPNHPVAVCNGDTLFLDKFAKYAPDVDVYAANVYRGDYGFGSFWQQVSEAADKPAFISEYGAPAFGLHMTYEEAQAAQAAYHHGNWLDILNNSAGFEEGSGNSVGGVAFEWLDEWWKNYEPALHDKKADVVGPFPGGYYFEEWFGLFGQGEGKKSPYLRERRKVYYTYRELWNS